MNISHIDVHEYGVGAGANEGVHGTIEIINPMDSGKNTHIKGSSYSLNQAPSTSFTEFWGNRENNEANDAFRLLFASGNIASGDYVLYGYRS